VSRSLASGTMRGPVFLRTAAGFVLKSFELDAGSSVLSWSGDDGSSGTIDLLSVVDILLPEKNAGLRIHLAMTDGTTEKLIVDSNQAREQWTLEIQNVCRENWSNIEVAAVATRFDFSTCFVHFCSVWFKSFHGDGSITFLDAAKFMEDICTAKAHVSIGLSAFRDRHMSSSSRAAAASATERVPMERVFEWVSELCELGYYGIAELCSLQVAVVSSVEDAVEALHDSCSSTSNENASWLGNLLNLREAFRHSDEESIAAAAASGILFSSLAQLLKEHCSVTGSMLSVFVVEVALDCLQIAFSVATSACCSHGQALALVARLSICGSFYCSSALDIMSLGVLDSVQTRMKTMKALSAAADASGKSISSALVDCLLSGMDCCVISVFTFCVSLLKSASSLSETESFLQLLCQAGLVAAAESIRDSNSNTDVLYQLSLFDDCMSKISTYSAQTSRSDPGGNISISVANGATTCSALLHSLLPRLEKTETECVRMLEEQLTLWLKLKQENYFPTFSILNKLLEHIVQGECIPAETVSALKALHAKSASGNRSDNRGQSSLERDPSVIQSVVDSFWELGSSVFGSDADADERMLKSAVEFEKLKREHAAALQEIKLLRQSIGVHDAGSGITPRSTENISLESNFKSSPAPPPLAPTTLSHPPPPPPPPAPGKAPPPPPPPKAPGAARSSTVVSVPAQSKEILLKPVLLQVLRCKCSRAFDPIDLMVF
jgi:hypothetical protein